MTEKNSLFKSRTASVVAGSAVLVTLGGVSGAFAAAAITSEDIKNGEVKKPDIATEAVGGAELRDGTVGMEEFTDRVAEKINREAAPAQPHYSGADWGIIDRNTLGNGDAFLRSGPSAAPDVQPPHGIGSLGLRTGSAEDKATFGNQVAFAGDDLSGVNTVKYSVFTTRENNSRYAANLPNVAVEVDTDSSADGLQYSSLVFSPQAVEGNKWTQIDATGDGWYYTGSSGTTSGCTQADTCTLAEAKEAFPKADILTVAFSKGRDYAFSGAVDGLVWNDTTYDFEPNGVSTTS